MARLLGFFCALSLSVIHASNHDALAQSGTAHGASLLGTSGGGCFYKSNNAPLPNPFVEPSTAGQIYCVEHLQNTVTYQGEGESEIPVAGTATAPLNKLTFNDNLGNLYSDLSTPSDHNYCGGQSCYPAAPNDGAFRTAFLHLTLPNLVKARNAKDEPNQSIGFRMASTYMVSGKAIGFAIPEETQQVIELAKDEMRVIEIVPNSPDFDDEPLLTNQAKNPYSLDWVKPDTTTTPHKEIVPAITFSSSFTDGRWRYFMTVKGEMLAGIGKYLVNFRLTREVPVRVSIRYGDAQSNAKYCNTATACDRDFKPYTTATLTVSYGTEQCLKKNGLGLPSYQPLLEVYGSFLTSLEKNFKPIFGPLNKLPQKDRNRLKARTLKNNLAQARRFMGTTKEYETQNLRSLTELYSAAELGALSQELVAKATEIIIEAKGRGKKRNATSIRRLSRSFKQISGFAAKLASTDPKTKRRYAKFVKTLKGAVVAGDKAYNEYVGAMQIALEGDRQLRENSFRCAEAF